MRTKYQFVGSSEDGKTLYWESVRPLFGDSRHEQISCSREWFWSRSTK